MGWGWVLGNGEGPERASGPMCPDTRRNTSRACGGGRGAALLEQVLGAPCRQAPFGLQGVPVREAGLPPSCRGEAETEVFGKF